MPSSQHCSRPPCAAWPPPHFDAAASPDTQDETKSDPLNEGRASTENDLSKEENRLNCCLKLKILCR